VPIRPPWSRAPPSGEQTVTALNQALLATAAAPKVLRTTGCGPTPPWSPPTWAIRPTLGCWPGNRQASDHVGRIRAAAAATRTTTGDRRRAAHRRAPHVARRCGRAASRPSRRCCVYRCAGRPGLQRVGDAVRVVRNARRHLARVSGSAGSPGCLTSLNHHRSACQGHQSARTRRSASPRCVSRLVSLHHPDARPILKGRLGKPVEFGSKAQWPTTPTGTGARRPGPGRPPLPRRCWLRPARGSRPAPAASSSGHRRPQR
jgi:IS5 family transposase